MIHNVDLCVTLCQCSVQAATLKKLAAEAQTMLGSFWGTDRRQMLCTALIDNLLPLTVIPKGNRALHLHFEASIGGL